MTEQEGCGCLLVLGVVVFLLSVVVVGSVVLLAHLTWWWALPIGAASLLAFGMAAGLVYGWLTND